MEKIILATTVLKKDQTKKRTAKINVQERSFPRALHHDRWSPPSVRFCAEPITRRAENYHTVCLHHTQRSGWQK